MMIAILTGFASAQAATGTINSETFYQASPEANVVTPALDYSSESISAKIGAASVDVKDSGPTLNFNYERGINDMFAAGITLGYKQGSSEMTGAMTSDNDENGLTDVALTFKGQNSFVQDSSLHYGAYLKMSTGNRTVDADGNYNAMSGGHSLTPFVGYQWLWNSNVIGVKYTQTIWGSERTTEGPGGSEAKEEGGGLSELKAFYEMPMDKWNLGFSAQYRANSPVEDTTTSTKTRLYDAIQTAGVTFYPTWNVNETTTVVGSLGYATLLSKDPTFDGATLEGVSILDFSVGGRFAF